VEKEYFALSIAPISSIGNMTPVSLLALHDRNNGSILIERLHKEVHIESSHSVYGDKS